MFDCQIFSQLADNIVCPQNSTLLVDTYNTLKSGIPDAIRAFNAFMESLYRRMISVLLSFEKSIISQPFNLGNPLSDIFQEF